MEENILNAILKDTYTVDSFKRRFQALRLKLEGEIYGGNQSSVISSQLPDEGQSVTGESVSETEEPKTDGLKSENRKQKTENREQEWLSSFDPSLLKGITSDQFSALSESVDKYINSLNSLTIYFVFLPDQAQIKDIGERLRKSLNNPKLIFNVKVDPGLIGGCAFVYKGVYRDYSLKARISDNKGKLIEEFRKYFKQ